MTSSISNFNSDSKVSLFFFTSNFDYIWAALATELREVYGHKIIGVALDMGMKERMEKYTKIDEFISIEDYLPNYDDEVPANVYDMAKAYEEKYGVLYMDIIQSDRHFGHSLSPLGVGHPSSYISDRPDLKKMTNYINKTFKFWEDLAIKYRPKFKIGLSSGVWGLPGYYVLLKHGSLFRAFSPPRYKNFPYWIDDLYFGNSRIEKNFLEIKKSSKSLVNIDEHMEQFWKDHNSYMRSVQIDLRPRISHVLKTLLSVTKKTLYQKLKNVATYSAYNYWSSMGMVIRVYRHHLYIQGLNLKKAQDLEGEKYFTYFLHTEPEISISQFAPEFNDQAAIIQTICKNLPAGHKLLVKEHPVGVGRRPLSFYRNILKIPNCIFADYSQSSFPLVKNSVGVITITGTNGFEGAVIGKPVISFGLHNFYNFVPHVHVLTDMSAMRAKLNEIAYDENDEIRKKDGALFLAAYIESSVEMPLEYLRGDRARFTDTEYKKNVMRSFIKSFPSDIQDLI